MLDTWRDLERVGRERPPLEVCLTGYEALLDGGEDEEREAGEALEAGDGAGEAVEGSHLHEVEA